MNFRSLISLNQQVSALVLQVNSPSSSPVENPNFPVNQRPGVYPSPTGGWWSCGEVVVCVADGVWAGERCGSCLRKGVCKAGLLAAGSDLSRTCETSAARSPWHWLG